MTNIATSDTPSEIDLLHAYVAERDVPCPSCRYNLRGLTSSHCPECGQALRLNVGLVHPKQAALITGLIGLSACAGFNGLLLLYAMIMIASEGNIDRYMMPFLLYNASAFAVSALLVFVWLLFWRRLQRRHGLLRWSLGCAAWLLTPLNVVLFILVVN